MIESANMGIWKYSILFRGSAGENENMNNFTDPEVNGMKHYEVIPLGTS
jgi:hypothetical protein